MSESSVRPSVHVTSSRRTQPRSAPAEPTTTYLSILDAAVASFGTAGALWVFEYSPGEAKSPPSLQTLEDALAVTLSAYPHFAGRLRLTPWPKEGHFAVPAMQRFRRSVVEYGHPTDPGVELQTATAAATVASIFPDATAQRGKAWDWDLQQLDLEETFGPSGDVAGNIEEAPPGTPGVHVRITTFSCQSVAIGLRIAHPLADAESMIGFMKAWGANHAAMLRGEPPPMPAPTFNPRLVDDKAAGSIDGPAGASDPAIVQQAHDLPLPRYDWWTPTEGNPPPFDASPQVVVPPEVPQELAEARRRGRRIPWEEWNVAAPAGHYIVRLTAEEVDALYQTAQRATEPSAPRISRHDVLLAFVWQLAARAKPPRTWNSKTAADGIVSLDTTLGLRPRLGLPSNFLGSPILLAGLEQPWEVVTGQSWAEAIRDDSTVSEQGPALDGTALAATATAIRTHLARFDSAGLAAWLHDMAFEVAPQRWWNGFLGNRHTLATSWVRSGVWNVDFGFDGASSDQATAGLRWAGVLGGVMDGLVVLTEAARSTADREWWREGVDVDVKLERAALTRWRSWLDRWRQKAPAGA